LVAREDLIANGWGDSETIAEWRKDAEEKVELAVAKVQREPAPDPFAEDWCALASKHLAEGMPNP